MSSNFQYQPFMAVSGNQEGRVPVVDNLSSSVEQKNYSSTSPVGTCIEFQFQMDLNFYAQLRHTYLTLKLKLVMGRDYEAQNSKEVKKEHKD